MKNYQEYITRKKTEYGSKFDETDLSKQFIPFYENVKRIEIEFSYGEKKRGTIGITTGWEPAFLLMLTKRSTGSSYTLRDNDKIIKIIN